MKTCIKCLECAFDFALGRGVYEVLFCKKRLLPSPYDQMNQLVGYHREIDNGSISVMLSIAEVCPEFKERHKSE